MTSTKKNSRKKKLNTKSENLFSTKRKPIIVQKYGGATLATPQKIREISQRISKDSKKGTDIVAVVSAMGQTTNDLIQLAQSVSEKPSRRELDMLLSTGERTSMALLTMALLDQKCDAISFTGSQAGILTNESHVSAFIKNVQAYRVDSALAEGKIVVLAGFQGVSPISKEITTLGRGGSDTTAVAMAAYLHADRCEILKDVPAVFSADPKLVKEARILHYLNYQQMLEMTFWGAKVLHYRCVELAQRKNVTLYIGPAHSSLKKLQTSGTFIQKEIPPMYETSGIIAVNSQSDVIQISANEINAQIFLSKLQKFFVKNEIASPQLLFINQNKKSFTAYFTAPSEILLAVRKHIPQTKNFKLSKTSLCSVSATCAGATDLQTAQKIFELAEKNHVPVTSFFQSAMTHVLITEARHRDKVIQFMHELVIS